MKVKLRRKIIYIQGSILLIGLFSVVTWQRFGSYHNDKSFVAQVPSRHLTSLPNCTPRAIEQFPRGLFTNIERQHGAIALHIFTAVYMFLGFALICDDYFVPSLEILCDVLHIQSDVAGATFMAAGSSAPELATAVIAVFIAKDDIGLGTVVGSAVYNVMFVISVCALAAGMVVYLHWWPLFRDCTFYLLSVVALALVIFDEKVFWFEALGLVLLYLLYIIIMYFNKTLEGWIVPKCQKCCKSHKQKTETIVLYDKLKDTVAHNGAMHLNFDSPSKGDRDQADGWEVGLQKDPTDSDYDSDEDTAEDSLLQRSMVYEHKEEPESIFAKPTVWWLQILWVLSLPLKALLYMSVPDCRHKRWRKFYLVTFLMSLVWLSVFSYLMVWMITIIGFTLNVPDTIMGLTFIAFGVSLPDVIASVIVVRDGLGDMAVSNAVGSNVFDILICLGVPWLLKTTLLNEGKPIQVYSEGLLYSSMTLLLTVVFLVLATHLNGWRLTKKYGVILMIVYLIFTVLTSLYELNLFGYVHPKECKSSY